jgi:hypothetical protein
MKRIDNINTDKEYQHHTYKNRFVQKSFSTMQIKYTELKYTHTLPITPLNFHFLDNLKSSS